MAHYGCSKAGIVSLTQSMAVDLARHDIQTNAVAPGWIRTRLTEALIDELDPDLIARINPQARVGDPDDIGKVVAFLLYRRPIVFERRDDLRRRRPNNNGGNAVTNHHEIHTLQRESSGQRSLDYGNGGPRLKARRKRQT